MKLRLKREPRKLEASIWAICYLQTFTPSDEGSAMDDIRCCYAMGRAAGLMLSSEILRLWLDGGSLQTANQRDGVALAKLL